MKRGALCFQAESAIEAGEGRTWGDWGEVGFHKQLATHPSPTKYNSGASCFLSSYSFQPSPHALVSGPGLRVGQSGTETSFSLLLLS